MTHPPSVAPSAPATDGRAVLNLPVEDRVSSPYTGLTRVHWEAAADGMLAVLYWKCT